MDLRTYTKKMEKKILIKPSVGKEQFINTTAHWKVYSQFCEWCWETESLYAGD